MPTPGFPPSTLDSEGTPIWITELADDDPNHCVHVARGIEPAQALEALGVKPELIQSCELPDKRPDRFSLPHSVLGNDPGACATLLAGRVGEWTFVYDDGGFTCDNEATEALSADGRTAATSTYTINADASLQYAVDGTTVEWVTVDDLHLDEDLPHMPAELRAAFEAAGVVEWEDEDMEMEPGEADYHVTMRAVCALAGLTLTLNDLRQIPLLVAPFA